MDDFLAKKKETTSIVDLSRSTCNSKEEFKKLMEKVPDFKIKPEKVPMDAVKFRDKNFKFKSGKKDLKAMREPYTFLDPLPTEMKSLKVSDLSNVQIDWKMLTTLRPKSKVEENYFSRLVEIGKLERKTRANEKRQFQLDPQVRRTKNKAGIVEYRVVSCKDCGEEFCDGKMCCKYGYDSFARVLELPKVAQKVLSPGTGEKRKKKIKLKRKSRSKSKTSKKKGGKSKSPKKK